MVDVPYVTDPSAALAAVNAATTITQVRDAFNTHLSAVYGVSMALQTLPGADTTASWQGLTAASFQDLRSYVYGMVKGLCKYPPAVWLGSDLVSFHMIGPVDVPYAAWAYPDRVFFVIDPLFINEEWRGEELLHHEGGHVLTFGYDSTWLPGAADARPDWLAQNPTGFVYGKPLPYPYYAGTESPLGFRSDYGRTNYFEDTAEVLAGLFDRDGVETHMPSRLAKDVRLRKKARIWALFLNSFGMSAFMAITTDPAPPPPAAPPADITVPASGPLGLAPLSCDGLGQVVDYTVTVTAACGSSTLAILDGLADLSYSRTLDNASTCEATVALEGTSSDLCGALGQVRAWCHELHVYRDGQEVWSGPVVRTTWAADRVVLSARDNSAWLDRLIVETKVDLKDTDLAVIGETLVRQAGDLGVVAGCLLLESTMTGKLEDRTIDKHSAYLGDALRELARTGLSYTALGRRLMLFGAAPLALIGPLSNDHFVGGLEVTEDGLDGCTRAVVVGNGVTGTYSVPGACGTVSKLVRDDTITTQRDADTAALRLVQGGYPWPITVSPGTTGAQLTADAPVCLDQLVPGVAVRTFASEGCRQFVTDLQLTNVSVQAGPDREAVEVTLAPAAPSGDFPVLDSA